MASRWAVVVAMVIFAGLTHAQPAPSEGDIAAAVARMGGLNWRTDGLSNDRGSNGAMLRNWDGVAPANGECDIFITYPEPKTRLVAVDFYLAWRMLPAPLLSRGARFDAELARAMFTNQTAQTKRVRVTGEAAMTGKFVDRWRLNGPATYYYVKLVGITASGEFVDVLDACVGSAESREDPNGNLPAAPDADECFAIERPTGDREARTRWEPFGSRWAPGHEPQLPPRAVAPANADVSAKLGALNWETNEGSYSDGGKGTALRVWNTAGNHKGEEPLYLYFQTRQNEFEAAHIDVYFGWRNFAVPRMTTGSRFYDADYLRAIFANETAQTKRVRIAANQAASGWLVDSPETHGRIGYYYVKLVGVTADGRFFDIRGWSAGSPSERADPRWRLEPLPREVRALAIQRPAGDRDAITRWEPYGTHYAPGHQPPAEPKIYPPANADLVAKLGALNWDTNGGKSGDEGTGSALRVWDTTGNHRGNEPLFITWRPNQLERFQFIDVYFAWRNFAVPRFNPASRHHDAEYVRAVFENRAAQSKRLRMPVPAASALVDRPADNGPVDYYYVKVVGVTADGQFVDVLHWEVADAARRADARWGLAPAPDDAEPLARPAGHRNLMTKWEAYGTAWAPGHEPPVVKPTYPPADADVATKLGALNWETNGGRSLDDGNYTALRNWECVGDRVRNDVIIMWAAQDDYELAAIDVYFAWRNFATGRMQTGERYFDAEYLAALFDNKTGQAARLRVAVADAPHRALIDVAATNGPNDYYYVKLVGVTTDGRFVDIVNWSIGSRPYRAERSNDLPEAPASPLPIKRPEGNREWRTPWESYGSDWKPGHEPKIEPRTYPPATAELAAKLGALNWDTNGGVAHDGGKGTALRNWEIGPHGQRDVFIMWEPPSHAIREIVVVYAWRNFALGRMTTGERFFDADYLAAMWANETAQTKWVKVAANAVPNRALLDVGTAGRPHDWYYVKLVGITEAGQLVDIVNWSIGSREYRAEARWQLPAAVPREQAVMITRPDGHRNWRTKWEPYGDEWAPGHAPPGPTYEAGTVPEMLCQLDWRTNGSDGDGGRGTACRIWAIDRAKQADLYFTWDEQPAHGAKLVAIDVYLARGFPSTQIFDKRQVERNATALQAFFDNQNSNVRRIRVAVENLGGRVFVDKPAINGDLDYRYAKLVGVLDDGRFVDLVNYEIKNLAQRRLQAVPAEWANAYEFRR